MKPTSRRSSPARCQRLGDDRDEQLHFALARPAHRRRLRETDDGDVCGGHQKMCSSYTARSQSGSPVHSNASITDATLPQPAVRDAFGAALALRLPHRAHAHARVQLVVRDADDVLAAEVARRAVEQHRRVDERLGLGLAVVRDRRDDREAGDGAVVADLDLVLVGRSARRRSGSSPCRARTPGRTAGTCARRCGRRSARRRSARGSA